MINTFTFTPTYEEFKVLAKDFILALPGSTASQAEAGLICLTQNCAGVRIDEITDNLEHQLAQVNCPAIMRFATDRYLAHVASIRTPLRNGENNIFKL